MRVVDVTQWHSASSGGIRTYLNAKAAWADEQGLAHAAIVTGPAPSHGHLGGSPLVTLRGRTPTASWGYHLAVRPGPLLAALSKLEPDVVVLHDTNSFPRSVARWARSRGVPLAILVHSDLAIAAEGLPKALRSPAAWALGTVQRRGLEAPDLVIVTSQESHRRVAADACCPAVISPLGVDLEPFSSAVPDERMRRELAGDDEVLLVYAGRLSNEKRVDLLPQMLAELGRPAVLALAGAGASAAAVRRQARALGVESRIRELGFVSDRTELATLMATADAFVHPSPHEPYGLAPLEAHACRTRVVAPRTGGTGETLTGRAGVALVEPASARALADGVTAVLGEARPEPDLSDLGWDATFAREWELYRRLDAREPVGLAPRRTTDGSEPALVSRDGGAAEDAALDPGRRR